MDDNSSLGKRSRADSTALNLLSAESTHNFKRLKTGDSIWAKIDALIQKEKNQLILFELPKNVVNFGYHSCLV